MGGLFRATASSKGSPRRSLLPGEVPTTIPTTQIQDLRRREGRRQKLELCKSPHTPWISAPPAYTLRPRDAEEYQGVGAQAPGGPNRQDGALPFLRDSAERDSWCQRHHFRFRRYPAERSQPKVLRRRGHLLGGRGTDSLRAKLARPHPHYPEGE